MLHSQAVLTGMTSQLPDLTIIRIKPIKKTAAKYGSGSLWIWSQVDSINPRIGLSRIGMCISVWPPRISVVGDSVEPHYFFQ